MSRTSRVKLMELREYVSDRTGATYFSGFLGKAKVVVLRDDRAECTGREKARWSVLLEEPEPREGVRPPTRSTSAIPESGPVSPGPKGTPRARRQTPADRAAGRMLREQGINPTSEMPPDEIPF